MKTSIVALSVLATLVACEPDTSEPIRPRPQATHSPTQAASPQPLDRLSIEFVLGSDTVVTGGSLKTFLDVENNTNMTIVDRACWLGAGRFGLIPVDDPGADLWQSVTVDCGGPFRMKPGFIDRFSRPQIQATNMTGDPLPPGEYLAVLEIEGYSERLVQPVVIEPAL
jgi:hypothetical protein